MKLDTTSNSVAQAVLSATQKAGLPANAAATANANATKSARSAGVSVTVSTQARELEKTDSSGQADVDMQKVAAVRTAMQEGTYVVNPEAIADKLLSNAQEMLNRTKS